MLISSRALAFAIAASAAPIASAAVVYDNGGPSGTAAVEMTGFVQADDFTLGTAAVVEGVRFWSAQEQVSSYRGSITWSIYANGGSTPGTLIATGNTSTVTRSATGAVLFGTYEEYVNDFETAPVALAAGKYWLGLHNGPLSQNTPNAFAWETTVPNAAVSDTLGVHDSAPFEGGWELTPRERAFQINATVPEPATLAVLAGVAAIATRRRRR